MKQSNRIPRGLVFSVFAGKAWLWKKVWRRNLARLGSKFENVKSPRPVSRADAASSKVTHKALFSQLCDWRLPWPRRFLAQATRGPEPGAQVLEPLPLTRIFGSPPDVSLRSLLSFFVFLYLSVCEASKLRSLPFTHPIYVASRYFQ